MDRPHSAGVLRINPYHTALLIFGIAFLAAAVIPRLFARGAAALPLLYVLTGLAIGGVTTSSVRFEPLMHSALVERLTEMAIIISLMSAGLKLDRPIGWRAWRSTWRLLAITMPLCIAALAFAGTVWLGMPLAAAILLGSIIAPTDPVLATSVQVGPPGKGGEDEPRFALTSEAGFNDGLAFPFVNLAVVVAATGLAGGELTNWLAVDVFWKIIAGVALGMVVGQLVATLTFRFGRLSAVSDGFVAIALTLVAYGATELVYGYGFLGVFVAALTFRQYKRDHEFHPALHAFSEQIEMMFMATLLMLFGASIAHGLLQPVTPAVVLVGLGALLVLRPLAGWLALLGTGLPLGERGVIAVFGIRGIGTFYYLAYGLNNGAFREDQERLLWATAGFIVLVSIVLHGASAAWAMQRVDQQRAREA